MCRGSVGRGENFALPLLLPPLLVCVHRVVLKSYRVFGFPALVVVPKLNKPDTFRCKQASERLTDAAGSSLLRASGNRNVDMILFLI